MTTPAMRRRAPPHRLALTALGLCLTACAPAPRALVPRQLDATFTGVPGRADALAWSPDGRRLALIQSGQLQLLDLASGQRRAVPGLTPLGLDWAPARELLVVQHADAADRLLRVAPDTLQTVGIPAPADLQSAHWLAGGPAVLAVTAHREVLRIGTQAAIALLHIDADATRELHSWGRILPTVAPDLDFTSGWQAATPNPLDGSLLLPQFFKPPQFAPYIEWTLVDPHDRRHAPLQRVEGPWLTALASWSPDGSRAAWVDSDGRLQVFDLASGTVLPPRDSPARGRQPAWNPAGSQIHLGGWLLWPDGQPIVQLVPDGARALARWSPDGRQLALLLDGTLQVLGPFAPELRPPDRALDPAAAAKLQLLDTLRRDGLIDDAEHQARRQKLRLQSWSRP